MDNNNHYAPPKAPLGDLSGRPSNSFIALYWSGRGKLWKIYWVYGIAVGWLVALTCVLAVRSGVSGRAMKVVFLPYYTWVFVSIWRCAFNTESRAWGPVARVLALIGFIDVVYYIVIGHSAFIALLRG
jgi:hypothetical protein